MAFFDDMTAAPPSGRRTAGGIKHQTWRAVVSPLTRSFAMTTPCRRFVSLLALATLALVAYGGGVSAATAVDVELTLPHWPPPHWPPRFNIPRFAYVADSDDDTVSIYSVNATTGQLRHSGYVCEGTIHGLSPSPLRHLRLRRKRRLTTSRSTPSMRREEHSPAPVRPCPTGPIPTPSPSLPRAAPPTWQTSAPTTSRPAHQRDNRCAHHPLGAPVATESQLRHRRPVGQVRLRRELRLQHVSAYTINARPGHSPRARP